ncbi:MAG: hypothetical protein OHK0046_23330 [Anaerolineae bacterium]
MFLDRSTRMFIAVFTLVAALVLIVNHLIAEDPLTDWLVAAVLVVISIVFWVWLWQERPATETTALVSQPEDTPRPVREWVLSEEVIATLERASQQQGTMEGEGEEVEQARQHAAAQEAARAAAAEPQIQESHVTDDDTAAQVVEEVMEAAPADAPVIESAKADEDMAEAQVADAMAAGPRGDVDAPEMEAPVTTEEVTQVAPASPELVIQPEEATAEGEPPADVTYEEQEVLVSSPPAEPDAAPAPEMVTDPGVTPDDLTKVEGIGPKYSATLIEAGIATFQQLAAASEERLVEIITAAGMRRPPSVGTWAEQASLAAREEWDALAQLQSNLTAGRRS